MLTFFLGAAGSGKTKALLQQLKENHNAKKYKRFILVVPKPFYEIAETQLSRLVGNKPLVNTEVMSFDRFLRMVATDFGSVSFSKTKEKFLLFAAIEKAKPRLTHFQHLDTFAVLQKIVAKIDLRESCGSRMVLELHDVAIILEIFDELLVANGYLEEKILLKRVRDWVSLEEAGFYFDSFFCFDDFEFEVLKILIEKTDVLITLPLPSEVDCAASGASGGMLQILTKLGRAAEKLGVCVTSKTLKEVKRFSCNELKYLAENFFKSDLKPIDCTTEKIAIVNAKSRHEEAQFVAAMIWKLIEEEGYCFADFLILVSDVSVYREPLKGQLSRYMIDCFWDMKEKRVCSVSRFISAFFQVLNTEFETEAVIELAKNPLFAADKLILGLFETYARAQQISGDAWLAPFSISGVWHPELDSLKNMVVAPIFDIVKAKKATAFEFAKGVYEYLESAVASKLASGQCQEMSSYGDFVELLDDFVDVFAEKVVTPAETKLLAWCWQKIDYVTVRKKTNQVTISPLMKGGWPEFEVVFILNGELGNWRAAQKTVDGYATEEDSESMLILRALTAAKTRIFVFVRSAAGTLCCSNTFFLEQLQRFFKKIKCGNTLDFLQLADFAKTPNTVADLLCVDLKPQSNKALCKFLPLELSKKMQWQNRGCENCAPKIARFSFAQVEDYLKCGFLFFCRHILKLRQVVSGAEEITSMLHGVLQRVCTDFLVSCFGNGNLKGDIKLNYAGRQKFFDAIGDENQLEKLVAAKVKAEFGRVGFAGSRWLDFLQCETFFLVREVLRAVAAEIEERAIIPFAFGVEISKRCACGEQIFEFRDEVARVNFLWNGNVLKPHIAAGPRLDLRDACGNVSRFRLQAQRKEIESLAESCEDKQNLSESHATTDDGFAVFSRGVYASIFCATKTRDCKLCEYFFICGNIEACGEK